MTTAVRIELLGSVCARVDDQVIVPRGVIGRSVLCRMALEPGKTVSTDELVDAVWDVEPPPKAVATVRSAISRLRTVLSPSAVFFPRVGAGISPRV